MMSDFSIFGIHNDILKLELQILHIFTPVAIGADLYCRRSLRPSVCPKGRYRCNSLKILALSLKFGGMVHSTMG